jgi:hypothetical protein
LARRADIVSWSFLTIFFAGGSFWQFVGAGGLFHQKFSKAPNFVPQIKSKLATEGDPKTRDNSEKLRKGGGGPAAF